ncbi:MAG TPA: tetratricopeptide repeat protein [Syntrophorhabdaceae bacterium]|nr:tetratricopeptide repeat protein [Syntrophorhabdaceae bacterium]
MNRSPACLAAACLIAALLFLAGFECPFAAETSGRPDASPVEGQEIPDWMARWELARVLSYAGRHEESISEYRKLLGEKPDLSKARIEMAKVLFRQKKGAEALGALEGIDARQLDADSVLLMADLYRDRKSYDRAAPLYREYLEKRPGDNAARLRLAEMLSWEKQYDRSLAEYRKILAALPGDVQVRRKYAMVLMWAKRYGEAAAELRRTLK